MTEELKEGIMLALNLDVTNQGVNVALVEINVASPGYKRALRYLCSSSC